MDPICNQCGSVKKNIPAGVSKKTGRPYKAFSACPKNCGKTQTTSPTGNTVPMAKSDDSEQLNRIESSLHDLLIMVESLTTKDNKSDEPF